MITLGRVSFWYEQRPDSQNERNGNGRRSEGFTSPYEQRSSPLDHTAVPSERRYMERPESHIHCENGVISLSTA